jgi:lipopolysaccharide export system permease protein
MKRSLIRPSVFDWMILRSFVPVFFTALLFFVLILQLVDLFANLVRYLSLEVPLTSIARVQILYIPKSLSFALPVALLFAVAFTLGQLYSNNELISVFAAGISLYRFVLPLLLLGVLLGIGGVVFEERVVIETLREKNELSRELLNINRSFSNTRVAVTSPDRRVVIYADYYNDAARTLSGVTVLLRNTDGTFSERIEAPWGEWNGGNWEFSDAVLFRYTEEGFERQGARRVSDEEVSVHPRVFQRSERDVSEMTLEQARDFILSQREAGLPFRRALTDYWNRYSFALTPVIVVLISAAVGGRFRKNIILMSLLLSLCLAVAYYVAGMVTDLMAVGGLLSPFAGAWVSALLFLFGGGVLFRYART